MGDAMSLPREIVTPLLEALREHGSGVFAMPADADFFRKSKSEVRSAPKPVIIEKVVLPSPKPAAVEKGAEIKPTPSITEPVKPNFPAVRNVLSVVAPELAILNDIPSDLIARKIAERWKTKNQTAPISILIFQEPPEQRAFLEQIAKALDTYFGPAKIAYAEGIEKEKQWAAFLSVADLKLILVCDYTLWQLNGLMQFYKETPSQGTRVLGNVPLFLLPDLSLYLKDPLLKRSLWKALCQKLS